MTNVHEANFELTTALSLTRSRKQSKWQPELAIRKLAVWFYEKGAVHILISLMLGRAVVMSQFTPFALPFFAVVLLFQKSRTAAVFLGLILGASTLSPQMGLYTAGALVLFRMTAAVLKNRLRQRFVLAGAAAGVLAVAKSIYLLTTGPLTWVDGVMISLEALAAGILALIFMQSFTIIKKGRKAAYTHEELVALAVFAASIAVGLTGWMVGEFAVSHMMTRYLVVVAALAAGALVGSTAGVVTGLIFCLSSFAHMPEVALLAVAGLLGGLLKSGKVMGVSLGLMLATLLTGLMIGDTLRLEASLYESAVTALLLFVTPKKWITAIARHVPGSDEYIEEQQRYALNVRDATAEKVERFSDMFAELSKSFSCKETLPEDPQTEADYMISKVTARTCQQCFKKEFCWTSQFDRTYEWMTDLVYRDNDNKTWESLCVKSEQVKKEFEDEQMNLHLQDQMKEQLKEGSQFVARQLSGLSDVMRDFASELQREIQKHDGQEESIKKELQGYGIQAEHVEIHCLEYGKVDLDIMLPFKEEHGECEKLIAPMLSSILKETIIVYKKTDLPSPYEGTVATYRSAKAFHVSVGVAHAAFRGGLVSGDSYTAVPLNEGKYAVAISDGMGNGEKAKRESEETIGLLQQMLKAGIDEELAIKSVNSILTVKRTNDAYSTVDLVMIDLQNAKAKFLKVGSVPSYIKRGKQIKMIEAGNLPLGFFREMEMDVLEDQLKAGDLLFMVSDGVMDGLRTIENPERWLRRQISELTVDDPQTAADLIMEAAVRSSGGSIEDDMTVAAIKIDHQVPKWAAIPLKRNAG
ncbi:stage II sporulation protein E [Jeotgalibacillus sp. R-1-5s-1]|uniref:stage II sporulation protein E n=1 Tax=Jeotgalibacillus sp. R-1-5s-1 TaxID=2555897 RepID=UPI00106DAB73|nr:stage II sporulation protein E [Jeotgalibacillus sp. R-1-5s-1]TFE01931.1 stage II sporulation protein E [Jeotgalibacillus sp. R-1-5s-1]